LAKKEHCRTLINSMNDKKIIGIDLGATNIRGGLVNGLTISEILSRRIKRAGSVEDVMEDVFGIIDSLIQPDVAAIGIGVPSVVDVDLGIVYDVQHIPSWKEVHLKKILEAKYNIPVFVNNDANCFATGEHYFGKGIGVANMIGLTVGTGLGAGIIIRDHLYAGLNCGAGEFGMVGYLDHCYEYYASGQFFENVHRVNGQEVFESATTGDIKALHLYNEMGVHLGNAIKMIMYTYDPSLIILGGSVRFAYEYFQESMWRQIKTFAFTRSIEKLHIDLSELENSGILGAAGLYYDRA
jgi:glucokinase